MAAFIYKHKIKFMNIYGLNNQLYNTYIIISQSYKSYKARVPYPTIHHFGTEICVFLFQSGVLWDMEQVHCGICETGLLW